MTVRRMDNVLIVVDDLEAVKAFFIALGLVVLRVTFAVVDIDALVVRMREHGDEIIS